MANETDADRIQRDRDRRRAEERLRIEREHHRRLHDVEALRRNPPHAEFDRPGREPPAPRTAAPPEPPSANPDEAPSNESAPPARVETPPPKPVPKPTAESPRRPIGRPVQSGALREFLALDPSEQFDIEKLNQLSFAPLIHERSEDLELLQLLADRSESLMDRVKREVDDPLNAGALLREFALEWYRRSPEQLDWGDAMPARWGGLFADSKVTGGKLHPWLNTRLWAVHERAIREGGVRRRVRHGLSRSHVAENSVSRTVNQQIKAEVAQAFLDDIAARPRRPDSPFPLVRLSELAVRRQVATVNDALAALFSSSESGPFVVLHPNRYPDCEEVQIRPPSGTASGAALAFALVSPKSSRRAANRPVTADVADGADSSDLSTSGGTGDEEVDAASIWDAKEVTPATWTSLLDQSHRDKARLDPPPRDYRSRAAYIGLRDLLLRDAEVRKVFLTVKWRGRPAGLPLLAALLQKGTISPEVSTDHEYLEAELGELSQGDPQFVPEGGTWKFPGWTVAREGSHKDGYRYSAQPDAPAGS